MGIYDEFPAMVNGFKAPGSLGFQLVSFVRKTFKTLFVHWGGARYLQSVTRQNKMEHVLMWVFRSVWPLNH